MTFGLFAGFGVALFFAYLAEARKLPIFGDGSAQALQAWDMLHGNLLLHGWVLSDVSFYSTELPQYMLIELVAGLNPDVVHIAAAMTYALLVVLTAVLAKGKATGREAAVRTLIPVGIMLAPPLGQILYSRQYSPEWILLSAPDHTGTQIPLVLIWLMLDRLRPRWWLPVAVAAVLTLAEIADPTAIFEGALPIAAVCAVRLCRRHRPPSARGRDLSLAAAALVSVGAATAALGAIRSHGGFAVNQAATVLVTSSDLTAKFVLKARSLLTLFGADLFGVPASHALIPAAHLVAIALVLWAVAAAARRFYTEDDLAMQVVTASFVVLLAAFLLSYRTAGREAVGLLPIGAALAGRMLASCVWRFRLVPALAAVLACYGVSLFYQVSAPALPSPDRPLASWLSAHHLYYGLSASWLASSGLTLYSGDQVRVRDVMVTAQGDLVRDRWNTKASWYLPTARHDARFVILNPCASQAFGRLAKAAGPPAATYRVGSFTVLVWKSSLLASHPRPAPRRSRRHHRDVTRQRRQPSQAGSGNPPSAAHRLLCGTHPPPTPGALPGRR